MMVASSPCQSSFVGFFFKDQLLTASGKVTALNRIEDEIVIDLELAQIDETGQSIAIGSARVALKPA